MILTARQDKLSDNRTYTIREITIRMKIDYELTSQASSTLVSASTDTIRESMRSGHSYEHMTRWHENGFIHLEQILFSIL